VVLAEGGIFIPHVRNSLASAVSIVYSAMTATLAAVSIVHSAMTATLAAVISLAPVDKAIGL